MKKFISYLLPSLFLLGIVGIVWYLFIFRDFVNDSEKRITGIIAFLGLGFGIFQFWVTEVNIRLRKLSEMRQAEYHRISDLIESIPDLLNIEMMIAPANNPHGLVSSLMNKINRLSFIINTNDDYLFPGIFDSKASKDMIDILSEILKRTDTLRCAIEKASIDNDADAINLATMIESMNWHNEIRDKLKLYHTAKYQ